MPVVRISERTLARLKMLSRPPEVSLEDAMNIALDALDSADEASIPNDKAESSGRNV